MLFSLGPARASALTAASPPLPVSSSSFALLPLFSFSLSTPVGRTTPAKEDASVRLDKNMRKMSCVSIDKEEEREEEGMEVAMNAGRSDNSVWKNTHQTTFIKKKINK
jgi:NAD kinase